MDPYLGEIRMFAGHFDPVGWFSCNGQLLSIGEYEALYNLIGTTYGGDGQSTFALPDLRSRIPVHQGNGGLLAESGGLEEVRLTVNELPPHRHTPLAGDGTDRSPDPSGRLWTSSSKAAYATNSADPATRVAMSGAALAPAGGSQAHENMPPFLGVRFIIACQGVYPSPT